MRCACTFDAPSHFLSANWNVNAFVHVALARSPLVLMKHEQEGQEGASLTRVASSNNHPYANTTSLLPRKQCPIMRMGYAIYQKRRVGCKNSKLRIGTNFGQASWTSMPRQNLHVFVDTYAYVVSWSPNEGVILTISSYWAKLWHHTKKNWVSTNDKQ